MRGTASRDKLYTTEIAAVGLTVTFVLLSVVLPITVVLSRPHNEGVWSTLLHWSQWASDWTVSLSFVLAVTAIGWWLSPSNEEDARPHSRGSAVHLHRARIILFVGVAMATWTEVNCGLYLVALIYVYGVSSLIPGNQVPPLVIYFLASVVLSGTALTILMKTLRDWRQLSEVSLETIVSEA